MDWKPQVLTDGLGFPEGPISMGHGVVVFTQIRGQQLSRYADGQVETLAHTGGGANGATLGPDGAFYVANNGGISTGPGGMWLVGIDYYDKDLCIIVGGSSDSYAGKIIKTSNGGQLWELCIETDTWMNKVSFIK